jgi:UDP-glucose 4-epimerase
MLSHQHPKPLKPARVVVLGASGFLASHLDRGLQNDQIVSLRVGSRDLDLSAPCATDQLKQILLPDDAVVMTAALTPDKGRDSRTLMRNLSMAESLCAALSEGICAQFIYISSDAVYGSRSSLIDEDACCEASDLYSLMHIGREQMLSQACSNARIPVAIVRPCAVYGPADTHNSYGPNRFIRSALSQRKISLFGEGEEKRDHVYVGDVVQIIKLCVQHRSVGVINAVSGRSVSFKDVARQVISLMPRGIELECRPRSTAVTHRHFDYTALLQSFPGFQPTPIEIGIKHTIDGMAGAGAGPEPIS